MPMMLATSAADGSVIIFVIVVAIWVVGAVLAKSGKKPGQKKRSWEEILRDLAGQDSSSTPPTMPPPAQPEPRPPVQTPRQVPAMRQQMPARQMPRPITLPQHPQMPRPIAKAKPGMRPAISQKRQRPAPPRIVVPPKPARPALSEALSTPAPASAMSAASHITTQNVAEASTAATRGSSTSPKAKALHKWLTPATMRGQFILTEVLRSPLSIREEI